MDLSLHPTTKPLAVFSVLSADHGAVGGGAIILFIINKALYSNRKLKRLTCLPGHVPNYRDIRTTPARAKLSFGHENIRTCTISSINVVRKVHSNDEIRALTRHASRIGMTYPEIGRNESISKIGEVHL